MAERQSAGTAVHRYIFESTVLVLAWLGNTLEVKVKVAANEQVEVPITVIVNKSAP